MCEWRASDRKQWTIHHLFVEYAQCLPGRALVPSGGRCVHVGLLSRRRQPVRVVYVYREWRGFDYKVVF